MKLISGTQYAPVLSPPLPGARQFHRTPAWLTATEIATSTRIFVPDAEGPGEDDRYLPSRPASAVRLADIVRPTSLDN